MNVYACLCHRLSMGESRKFLQGVRDIFFIFSVINVFLKGSYKPPSIGDLTQGYKCFSRGFVPEFLRKPLATCDFPGGPDALSTPTPLDPPILSTMKRHKIRQLNLYSLMFRALVISHRHKKECHMGKLVVI